MQTASARVCPLRSAAVAKGGAAVGASPLAGATEGAADVLGIQWSGQEALRRRGQTSPRHASRATVVLSGRWQLAWVLKVAQTSYRDSPFLRRE